MTLRQFASTLQKTPHQLLSSKEEQFPHYLLIYYVKYSRSSFLITTVFSGTMNQPEIIQNNWLTNVLPGNEELLPTRCILVLHLLLRFLILLRICWRVASASVYFIRASIRRILVAFFLLSRYVVKSLIYKENFSVRKVRCICYRIMKSHEISGLHQPA